MPASKVVRHVVTPASALPPGSRCIVSIGRRSIGVFNVDGEYFAVRNRCPHQGGPLCVGTTSGLATERFYDDGPPGVEIERHGEIVKCPWHGWQFDMRTGEAVFGERVRVATYRAYRAGDAGADGVPPEELGVPGNVEVYRALVDGDNVVVEIPVG